MLVNCNTLSQVHLQKANVEFKKHAQLLNEIKRDLENIFKRIKTMKAKAATQYPHQYEGKKTFFKFVKLIKFILNLTDAISKIQTPIEEEDEKIKDA